MKITIYSNLKKCPSDYKAALNEYIKRISAFAELKVIYRNKSTVVLKRKKDSFNIFVSCDTNSPSSVQFADMINNITLSGYSSINFIMSPDLAEKSENDYTISLSSFKLSDELSDIVMTEQIYRAFCINNNITYHK